MALESLINRISEETASKNVYSKCWKKDLTDYSPAPITEDEFQWIIDFLNKDFIFKSYSQEKKDECLKLIKDIEKKVPIISGTGKALPYYHRLYISAEIAKALLNRSKSVINILSSVVVYPGMKLRKEFNEGGLLLSQGFKRSFVKFSNLIQFFDAVSSYTDGNPFILGTKFKSTLNEFKYWRNQLNEDLDEKEREKFLKFLNGSLKTLEQDFIPTFKKFMNKLPQGSSKETLKQVPEQLSAILLDIIKTGDDLVTKSEASIHMSWLSHFTYLASKSNNLIIHELAHAIDFEYAGIDGVPSTDLAENSTIIKKWADLFEEAEAGEFKFLNPYGLTNCYEFFAVTTEHYFREPSTIKKHAPKLYEALAEVYGPEQGDIPKWSNWKFIKTLFFSKLRSPI